jgi:hypothetical protein
MSRQVPRPHNIPRSGGTISHVFHSIQLRRTLPHSLTFNTPGTQIKCSETFDSTMFANLIVFFSRDPGMLVSPHVTQ